MKSILDILDDMIISGIDEIHYIDLSDVEVCGCDCEDAPCCGCNQ
jgi:hypothetical protein